MAFSKLNPICWGGLNTPALWVHHGLGTFLVEMICANQTEGKLPLKSCHLSRGEINQLTFTREK